MDRLPNPGEETAESINSGDQGLSALDPFESFKSESNALAEPMEALLRISQDMAQVLDKVTAPKAPIDMVRRHRLEEFHRTSMEEFDKTE